MTPPARPSRLPLYVLSSFAKLLGLVAGGLVLGAILEALVQPGEIPAILKLCTGAAACWSLALLLYDTSERRLLEVNRRTGSPPLSGWERLYTGVTMRSLAALTTLIAAISCCALWLDRTDQLRDFAYNHPAFWLFPGIFGFTASVALLPIIVLAHIFQKPRRSYLFCLALFLDLSPWLVARALQ